MEPASTVRMVGFLVSSRCHHPGEDRGLETAFGQAYRLYKAQVPRWLGKSKHSGQRSSWSDAAPRRPLQRGDPLFIPAMQLLEEILSEQSALLGEFFVPLVFPSNSKQDRVLSRRVNACILDLRGASMPGNTASFVVAAFLAEFLAGVAPGAASATEWVAQAGAQSPDLVVRSSYATS